MMQAELQALTSTSPNGGWRVEQRSVWDKWTERGKAHPPAGWRNAGDGFDCLHLWRMLAAEFHDISVEHTVYQSSANASGLENEVTD